MLSIGSLFQPWGAKVDAVAGLLSVVPVHTRKVGAHYGQCREICGMNYAFMPLCLEMTTTPAFFWWVLDQRGSLGWWRVY